MESTLADEAGATAPAAAPAKAGGGKGRKIKSLMQHAKSEMKYQIGVSRLACHEALEHKGYISPDVSKRYGKGRIIMGMSSKRLMIAFQILFVLFAIIVRGSVLALGLLLVLDI